MTVKSSVTERGIDTLPLVPLNWPACEPIWPAT
jgi:hypothetical protein